MTVRGALVTPLLAAALILLTLASLTIGRYPVSFAEVARIVATTDPFGAIGSYQDKSWVAVEIVRMPRILVVVICGMGLALSGAAMQGVFRNPLVGPEIAGVSSGAALGGVVALVLGWTPPGVVALAFAAGMTALLITFGLARITGRGSILALVLAGVIIGGFCASMLGLVEILVNPATTLPTLIFWLLGSFVGASYQKLVIVSAVTLAAGTTLLALRWRINLLSLGEDDAKALGVNVEILRWLLMALVALIVAAQVSVSGRVGWVGLIVPHLARLLVGPEHGRLLPAAALLGGIYLLGMDDIARTLTNQEIPIGLLTGSVGGPIFAFLFWKQQGRGWGRD